MTLATYRPSELDRALLATSEAVIATRLADPREAPELLTLAALLEDGGVGPPGRPDRCVR